MNHRQQEFAHALRNPYFAHVHTTLSDGVNTPGEWCVWAIDNGYKSIVFADHVRMNFGDHENNTDPDKLMVDMEQTRNEFRGTGLIIWRGIEAQVMPGGGLNAPKELIEFADVLYIANHTPVCHTYGRDNLIEALGFAFINPDYKEKIRVWAHPGLHTTNKLLVSQLMADATKAGVYIEQNRRYNIPSDDDFIKAALLFGIDLFSKIIGWDAHKIPE